MDPKKKLGIAALTTYGCHELFDSYNRITALKRAHEAAAELGKRVLNISCGPTPYGHVNADIADQAVPGFVKVEPNRQLPFADDEFGAVYSSHTIEHTDDPHFFFSELNRVGERVFCTYPRAIQYSAFYPFHKWVVGPKTIRRNPFYSEKVEDSVNRANIWNPVPAVRFYYDSVIQPKYFPERPQNIKATNYVDKGSIPHLVLMAGIGALLLGIFDRQEPK